MSTSTSAWLTLASLVALLALVHVPFGNYMAWVFTSGKDLRVERLLYRLVGVDSRADQRWPVYARSLLAFTVVSIVVLYLILRLQPVLPLANGAESMPSLLALNTASSFVTNTNWQSYSGESLGFAAQMAGLAVQNFLSAAVGISVAIALVRGLTRTQTSRIGNFWVDVTRAITRILLPIAVVAAVVYLLAGVIQNFGDTDVAALAGGVQTLPGGPVASQEAIKNLGTNGGGFFNANSAHPFENPTAFTNLLTIFLFLVIPFSLPRTFGRMTDRPRQGYTILAAMVTLWAIGVGLVVWFQSRAEGIALQAAGAALEGQELRFGIPMSGVFAASTTLTSTGSVNSFHDSYTPLAGGVLLYNMGLGEIAPGGVGSGLYGMLVIAVLTVFLAGLMVGRTPEFLGNKIQVRQMKLVSVYVLVTPALVLVGTAIAMATEAGRSAMLNTGPHGLSEVLYGFMSTGNNNGSAFAGLGANTDFYNIAFTVCMLLGRLLCIVLVLALAGSFAAQGKVPDSSGTLPTARPQFVVLLCGVAIVVAGLVYFPALALGPIAEGLS